MEPDVAAISRSTPSSTAPVALVTGTSSGMGLHAAVELAVRGLTVVATMRDLERAEALRSAAQDAGVVLDLRVLDVTDPASVTECVAGVVADHGRLDVLLNNAGRGAVGTAEQVSLDEIRDQLEVNYLGPVALTQAALPHMRSAGSGRILTVTSVGGAVGQPFADAYCGAKFAVEGFMQSLAAVMLEHGVRVSVIEPAAVASDFVTNARRPQETDNDGPYARQLAAYLARSEVTFAAAQSARDAGRAIADAVTAEDYRFRWQTSTGAAAFVGMSLADLDGDRVLSVTRTWIA